MVKKPRKLNDYSDDDFRRDYERHDYGSALPAFIFAFLAGICVIAVVINLA